MPNRIPVIDDWGRQVGEFIPSGEGGLEALGVLAILFILFIPFYLLYRLFREMPKWSNAKLLLAIFIGIFILMIFILAYFSGPLMPIMTDMANPTNVANNFMISLKNENYEQAFDMVQAERQKYLGGSAAGLERILETEKLIKPISWNFTSVYTTDRNLSSDFDRVYGEVTLNGGEKKPFSVSLQRSFIWCKVLSIQIA